MQTHPIKSIQALRGIAALLVLVFHYKWSVGLMGEDGFIGSLVNAGGIGVTIFFILSGFIMVYSSKHKTSPLEFAINRFSRIYPLYLFFIMLCFFISGAMSTFHYEDKTVNLINSFFFFPVSNDNAPAYIDLKSLSAVRWTLGYEMFFYVLLAFSMFFKHKNIALFSVFSLLLVIIPSLSGFFPTLSVNGYAYDSVILSFITNPIMYEFVAGVIIAIFINKIDGICGKKIRLIILSISTILVVYFCFYRGMNDHGFDSSALYLSIFFGSIVMNKELLDRFTPKFMVYIGEISFSIYLLHNPIMYMTRKYFLKVDQGWLLVCTATILTLAASFLSHNYLEVKASRWVKKMLLKLVKSEGNTNQDTTSNIS